MKRCEKCGSTKTARGRPLTGRHCSPECLQTRKKPSLSLEAGTIIGMDFGSTDTCVEVKYRKLDDGGLLPVEWKVLKP